MSYRGFTPRAAAALGVLALAGLAGNYLSIPLFFGVDFILGSIAVMLVLRLFGAVPGVIVAVIAGSYTFILWNHPYALLILTAEALFVGSMLRRGRNNLVLLDAAYWVVIGTPLIWLFYFGALEMDAQATLLVMLKQSVNGILNTVLASLLIGHAPLVQWVSGIPGRPISSLRHTLFNIMMLLAIVPVLMTTAADSRREFRQMETTSVRELESVALKTEEILAFWLKNQLRAVSEVARTASREALKPSARLQETLENTKRLFPDFYNMYIAEASARTVAFHPPVNAKGQSTIGIDFSDRPYYREMKTTGRPVISDVFEGRGGVFSPIVTLSVPMLKAGKFSGYVLGAVNLDHIRDRLATFNQPWLVRTTLLDRNNTVIASTRADLKPLQTFEQRRTRRPGPPGTKVSLFSLAEPGLPPMEQWRQSYFVRELPFSDDIPWTVVVESPLAPFRERLYRSQIGSFTLILVLILLAVAASQVLSGALVGPLRRLAAVTSNLPSRVSGRERVDLPESPVLEIDSLIKNFRAMAEALSGKFQEIESANRTIRESEEKYRTLFEQSKDVVFISSREGRFLDINPAGIELFGYASKDEMLKMDIPEDLYLNAEDRRRLIDNYGQKGYVKDFEVVMKKKDGEPVTVLITATVEHDEAGGISMFRGTMRDVTQLKKLEQLLLQAQKMEAVGQLAGGVAHDFNNILTAIVGYGNLATMQMSEDDPLRMNVENILAAAERAANLTHGLLAFSRKQIINPKPVQVNAVVRDVEKLLRRLIGEDIEFRTVLTPDDPTVMADSGQIQQVLMNLATNARDAMPNGGALTIETSLVHWKSGSAASGVPEQASDFVLVALSDTGAGMDEKVRSRIFEPFFTTKEVGRGTGLGLAIVYGIVAQHDGFIEVSSIPGSGTTFRVHLPVVPAAKGEAVVTNVQPLRGGAETVLVAEDDPAVRELIVDVLGKYGYRVLAAGDGEEAVRLFHENAERIDLLLLDVIMPKKNGRDVLREIASARPGIRALFLSGYTADIIQRQGLDDASPAVIMKPVSLSDLLGAVRAALDKGRGSQEA
ncbi:MAG: hypothetical protein A2X56_06400 [Nitrospirae bacterium GWC2_57_13]|nr:MAG: hypothetical protein A2X56_06400 [Nitrospirae bacterium GWC2_57_13]OGW45522.1 MAG: hypothetical protein A2X57_09365 [Nitrospirae bacterium GWD2_57_8]